MPTKRSITEGQTIEYRLTPAQEDEAPGLQVLITRKPGMVPLIDILTKDPLMADEIPILQDMLLRALEIAETLA